MVLGIFAFMFAFKAFTVTVVFASQIKQVDGASVIIIMIGLWLSKALWNLSYQMQDDFWYRLQWEKTGDDFEERYKKNI